MLSLPCRHSWWQERQTGIAVILLPILTPETTLQYPTPTLSYPTNTVDKAIYIVLHISPSTLMPYFDWLRDVTCEHHIFPHGAFKIYVVFVRDRACSLFSRHWEIVYLLILWEKYSVRYTIYSLVSAVYTNWDIGSRSVCIYSSPHICMPHMM